MPAMALSLVPSRVNLNPCTEKSGLTERWYRGGSDRTPEDGAEVWWGTIYTETTYVSAPEISARTVLNRFKCKLIGVIFPKFTIHREVVYTHHRAGWQFVVDAMRPLLRDGGDGVLLDCSIERSFARDLRKGLSEGWLPHRRPWVGVVHVPPDIPSWADWKKSPREIGNLREWHESLKECRGLVTFSQTMAAWLRQEFPVPVLALRHPVPEPPKYFRWDDFEASAHHGVVQVGWWLRRLSSIHKLPIDPRRKRILIPVGEDQFQRFFGTLASEMQIAGVPPLDQWNCTVVDRLANEEYDNLLASQVVFLDLAGAVAVNTILECIVRHTPVLVNRLPSVVEYLGPEYPLYYTGLEEAAQKAEDLSMLERAHRYLLAMPKEPLGGERFLKDFAGSSLYQDL